MLINTILVQRSRSCHVKTLHLMLRINLYCMQHGIQQEITYVNDDVNEKSEMIARKLKGNADKLIFIDFGVTITHDDIPALLGSQAQCAVIPAPAPGVDWGMFRDKVLKGDVINEPVGQQGIHFDTDVSNHVKGQDEGTYQVVKTNPKVWVMNRKACADALKQKKGQGIMVPSRVSEIFDRLVSRGVKVWALTKMSAVVTYPHECVSNILEAAGVKAN
jgi:hypothetical protein